MWIVFDSITRHDDLVSSKTGNTYTGYVLKGTKKGFQGEPDAPYEKVFFDTQATTVIEKGVSRPGKSVVQFFQKACKPGDTIIIKNERDGKNWRIVSVENIAGKVPTYEPLPDEYDGSEPVKDVLPPNFGERDAA